MFGREKQIGVHRGYVANKRPVLCFHVFREKRGRNLQEEKKKDDTEENLYKVRKVSSNCLEKRSHQSTAGPLQNAFYFPLWYLRPVSNVELYMCRI